MIKEVNSAKISVKGRRASRRYEACKLCGNNIMELSIETNSGNYLRCSECGFVQLSDIQGISDIKKIYDNSEYFAGKGKDGTGADFIGEEKLYLERFRNRIGRIGKKANKGRIFDIGASVGQFLSVARDCGWDVSGLEISATAAALAKERFGLDIHVGSLDDTQLPENSFDVVTLWHVFEHLPDPKRSIDNIRSALLENGLLVMELPNIGSLEALRGGVKWKYLIPHEHLCHYTPDTITRLLETSGLSVEGIEYEPGGTGVGEKMNRMGMGAVKKLLLMLFPVFKWLKTLMLRLLVKNSREIMIVYARKTKQPGNKANE